MLNAQSEPILLAMAIRSSRYGYAVLVGMERLLDWGAGRMISSRTKHATSLKRIAFLLEHFRPDMVIVRRSPHKRGDHLERASALIRFIRREAAPRGIPIVLIGASEHKSRTKYETASALAATFPELRWKLPPKRKNWQSEAHFMIIFDAIATGTAYWQAGVGNTTSNVPNGG